MHLLGLVIDISAMVSGKTANSKAASTASGTPVACYNSACQLVRRALHTWVSCSLAAAERNSRSSRGTIDGTFSRYLCKQIWEVRKGCCSHSRCNLCATLQQRH